MTFALLTDAENFPMALYHLTGLRSELFSTRVLDAAEALLDTWAVKRSKPDWATVAIPDTRVCTLHHVYQ